MLLANLNVFLPALAVAMVVIGGPISVAVSSLLLAFSPLLRLLTEYLPFQAVTLLVTFLPFALVACGVIFVWAKFGLAPVQLRPDRHRRNWLGHRLLFFTTVAVLVALVAPFALAALSRQPNLILLSWFAIPVLGLALITWAAGLFMVWSSRAPTPNRSIEPTAAGKPASTAHVKR